MIKQNILNIKIAFLLAVALLISSNVNALNQQEVFFKAVDDINCVTQKLLLTGFDRPIAARNIKTCTYNEIAKELNVIQENQTKGYKQMFISLADNINSYKKKIDNPAEYSLYENALEDLSGYALDNFRGICEKFAKADNNICVKLDQKMLKLEVEINNIKDQSLSNISRYTYGETSGNRTSNVNTNTNTNTEVVRTTSKKSPDSKVYQEEQANQTPTLNNAAANNANDSNTRSSAGTSWFALFMLLLLTAIAVWLYRENTRLKGRVEDVEVLLNMFNKKKTK